VNAEAAAEAAPAGAETAPAESSEISQEEVSALLEKPAADGVRLFDFGTVRVNRTELPMLQFIGKTFAERARATLSGLVNREVACEFTSIDSVQPADLLASLPTPGSVAVVRLKPLAGQALICIEPGLLLALMDGFFGGTGRATADGQAAVAPAARRFLALVLRHLGPDFTLAWTPVSPLEMEFVKQELNPRLLPLGGPQDSLTVVRFTAECASIAGRIDWVLPESLLAPLHETLASDGGKAPAAKQDSWAPALGAALQEMELEIRAVLAQAEISLGELVGLAPGDIIPIEPPQDVSLLVGDVPLRRGRFGVSQGRNALKMLPGGHE
jgi:flagellar motor switch protein FliM